MPSGGSEKEWQLIADINFADEENLNTSAFAFSSEEGYDKLVFIWGDIRCTSTTADSGLSVYINESDNDAQYGMTIPVWRNSYSRYGYTVYKHDGKFIDIARSAGAIVPTNFSLNTILQPYNLIKATSNKIYTFRFNKHSIADYKPVMGTLAIYGR